MSKQESGPWPSPSDTPAATLAVYALFVVDAMRIPEVEEILRLNLRSSSDSDSSTDSSNSPRINHRIVPSPNSSRQPPQCSHNLSVIERSRRRRRVPPQPQPIEKPSEQQLIFWALREGILQRLAPHEVMVAGHGSSRLSSHTEARLRSLYSASVNRWRQREASMMAVGPRNQEKVIKALAALGAF